MPALFSFDIPRIARLFTVLVLALLGTAILHAQSTGSPRKENLDLPFDAAVGDEHEEAAPEVLVFYGEAYETEAVFFCLDQSLSMGQGEWQILQRELIRVISELSSSMEFGIVFFHEEATVFPASKKPAVANAGSKASAIAMVQSTKASNRSTCFLPGLREALNMANQSSAKRRTVIFMSDGKVTCVGEDTVKYTEKTLQQTKAMNTKRTVINTLGVGREVIEFFMESLATRNGGTFRRVRN